MRAIPQSTRDAVAKREGRRCRACARERDDLLCTFLPRGCDSDGPDPRNPDDVVQVCADCRAAVKRCDLGISGQGNGTVTMYGTGPTRSGHWTTTCRAA